MDKELKQLRTMWADRDKRDDARELAKKIVADNRDELAETFEGLSTDQIVAYVEQARADGDEDAVSRADAWMLGAVPQQRVVGGN